MFGEPEFAVDFFSCHGLVATSFMNVFAEVMESFSNICS